MAEDGDKTAQQQVKEGIWRIATQVVVILVAAAFGVLGGYVKWGEAPALREQVKTLSEQIVELKNEREGASARQAMCERDKTDFKQRLDKIFKRNNQCQSDLAACRKQPGN